MRSATALLLCASALQLAAGARDLLAVPAMAPGAAAPSGAMPKSDLTFILSAQKATFKTTSMLELTGVSMAVPNFMSSGNRVSSMPTTYFLNTKTNAPLVMDGAWLGSPQALLFGGDAMGNLSSIALNLMGVQYDNTTNTASFNVSVVSADSVKLSGPVSTAFADSQQSQGPALATSATAGQTWTAVTLVVQSMATVLKQPGTASANSGEAMTKSFGFCIGSCGYGGWGGGYGGYNNYGYGYNRGYNGYGNGWGWGR